MHSFDILQRYYFFCVQTLFLEKTYSYSSFMRDIPSVQILLPQPYTTCQTLGGRQTSMYLHLPPVIIGTACIPVVADFQKTSGSLCEAS